MLLTRSTAAASADAQGLLTLLISDRIDQADSAFSLDLTLPDGSGLPAWSPGSHIDVVLPNALTRQYSLCGSTDPDAPWRICVQRDVHSRGGSAWIAANAHAGQTLQVRMPRNDFPLVPARRYRFVAGGIGITPLLPMVRELIATGKAWTMLYGGRCETSMAFRVELAELGEQVTIVAQDVLGLPDLDTYLADPDGGEVVYCCGHERLIEAVEQRCATWSPHSLHVERFAADPRLAAVSSSDEQSFDVQLERSGITVTVPPDRSILAVIQDAGIDVLSSCTEGVCGTCETTVLGGVPHHRDSLLTEDEKVASSTMMICVSRCREGPLVLEL